MGILIALFILVVIAFVIVICPILCLVKICKMAAKINSLERDLSTARQKASALTQPPPVAEIETPAVALVQTPEIEAVTVEVVSETFNAAPNATTEAENIVDNNTQTASHSDEKAADSRHKKSNKFEERSSSIFTRIGIWLCVGDEYRTPGVSGEYAAATTWLIRLGVLILLFGIGFFLKYSFENNLVSPEIRVSLMVISGLAMVFGGIKKSKSKYRPLAIALAGSGFVTLFLSVTAAYKLYNMIPMLYAFPAMLVITVAAMAAALGTGAQAIALLGCCGGYLTPVFINNDSGNIIGLFAFMALLNAGTLLIARYRSWTLLNIASFVFYAVIGGFAVSRLANAENALYLTGLLALNYVIFCIQQAAAARKRDLSFVEILVFCGNLAFFFAAALPVTRAYLADIYMPASVTISGAVIGFIEAGLISKRAGELRVLSVFMYLKICFSLIMTVPLLLGGEWVITAWAVMAMLIMEAAIRLKSRSLTILSILLYCATAVKWGLQPQARYSQDTDFLSILISHLLGDAVYIICLTISGVRMLKHSYLLAVETGKGFMLGVMAKVFIAIGAILFMIYSSWEVFSITNYFIPDYRLAILVAYWSILAVITTFIFNKRSISEFLAIPLLLLVFTGFYQFFFAVDKVYGNNFLQGLMLSLVASGIYIVSIFTISRAFKKFSSDCMLSLPRQKGLRQVSTMLFIYGSILFFYCTSMKLYECLDHYVAPFRHGGVTVYWSLLAIFMLTYGIAGQSKVFRMTSIGLFVAAAFKVFFLDLSNLDQLWRIVAFAAIGMVMLAGALIYIRCKDRFMQKENEDTDA